jgi:hypothetical protein
MLARRSTLGPEVIELTIKTRVKLKKHGVFFRSDHLRKLKHLALDLALDDYDFSQAEVIRAAISDFLDLPLGEQVHRLEQYRQRETDLGVGLGSSRPRSDIAI